MKLKRGKMLIDPPASASSDIALILIIFFLVCIVNHLVVVRHLNFLCRHVLLRTR